MISCSSSRGKLETPIERALPLSRISWKAFQVSRYFPRFGVGQWMRYRSTYSRPRRSREASIAFSAESWPWSSFHSLVVTKISSRGMPLPAMARPTPSSLP